MLLSSIFNVYRVTVPMVVLQPLRLIRFGVQSSFNFFSKFLMLVIISVFLIEKRCFSPNRTGKLTRKGKPKCFLNQTKIFSVKKSMFLANGFQFGPFSGLGLVHNSVTDYSFFFLTTCHRLFIYLLKIILFLILIHNNYKILKYKRQKKEEKRLGINDFSLSYCVSKCFIVFN